VDAYGKGKSSPLREVILEVCLGLKIVVSPRVWLQQEGFEVVETVKCEEKRNSTPVRQLRREDDGDSELEEPHATYTFLVILIMLHDAWVRSRSHGRYKGAKGGQDWRCRRRALFFVS
jgi:hypothetical protein